MTTTLNSSTYKERILDILVQARGLIADEDHWTKGAMARNAAGEPLNSFTPGAVCWCAEGAVVSTCGTYNSLAGAALEALQETPIMETFSEGRTPDREEEPVGINELNDHSDTYHEDVLQLFDQAINIVRRDLDSPVYKGPIVTALPIKQGRGV